MNEFGFDLGTIAVIIEAVDKMTPVMQDIASSTSDFSRTVEQATGDQSLFNTAMNEATSSATDAALQQAALATSVKTGSLATTEAAVATTALSSSTLDAKKMMAEMVAQANADYDAKKALTATTGELTLAHTALSVSLETVGYAFGLVSLAVVAFGPRIWELIGGWEGLKDIGEETYGVLEDLGQILDVIGTHVLNSVIQGLTATIGALTTIGGFVVDTVVAFSEFWLIAPIIDGITASFGFLRDAIKALAGGEAFDELVAGIESLKAAGFEAPTVTFGIDPKDASAVTAAIGEMDAAMVQQRAAAAAAAREQERLNEQMREYEVVGEAQLITASKQVVTFDAMREALEAMQSPLTISAATMKEFNADADFDKMRQQLEAFNSPLTITSETLQEMNAAVDFNDMREQLEAMEGPVVNIAAAADGASGGFMDLGGAFLEFEQNFLQGLFNIHSAALVTFGEMLNMVGTALKAFAVFDSAIRQIGSSFETLQKGLTGGFSLSSFSNIISGIGGIAGAAASAISIVSALGSAIKRAFTSEETELVNPNRDLFTSQFIGAETDPFQAIANSTIQAAMSVYGVDWDTAWAQYAEPLIRNLQDADTYAEFKNAQLALGELFKQAGVTLDIFNEAGIATQYQSSVFDNATTQYGIPTATFGSDPTMDSQLANAQKALDFAIQSGDADMIADAKLALEQLTKTGAGSSVTGAYTGGTYGGTYFQSGSMAPMGGSGLCLTINGDIYVNGSTGQQQAKSFFDALYEYVAGGGDGLAKWRELNCAAAA